MKAAWLKISVVLLVLGWFASTSGQTADSLATESGLIVNSPYTVNVFPSLPQPIGLIPDSVTSLRNFFAIPFDNLGQTVEIAPDWSTITITETADGQIYRIPFTAPLEWYFNTMMKRKRQLNFLATMQGKEEKPGEAPASQYGGKSLELVGVDVGDLGRVSLRVHGNVNISGKMVFQDQDLVFSNINQAQNTHIEFDQKQNLNIEGKIGDRITVLMDQDSERDFDWENNIRITYTGDEDEIVQKVEAGNISLSLPATQYVTFSGKNQGLFGLKAISKLGPVDITTIASIEQTRKEKQEYKGKSTSSSTVLPDYQYRINSYFFIHPWFRSGVDTAYYNGVGMDYVTIPPFYPLSDRGQHYISNNVRIKDFELYKSVGGNTQIAGSKEGTAYIDIDEKEAFELDNLQKTFVRLELDKDYTINEDLGFIRMMTALNSGEVLGCAFTLATRDSGRVVRQFGFIPAAGDTLTQLELQMIRPDGEDYYPSHPLWDLMFKNVYYLGANNINKEGFEFRIINTSITPPSERDPQGISYLELFGVDRINEEGTVEPDQLIDISNPNIINMVTGELLLPAYHPFVYGDEIVTGGSDDPRLEEQMSDGEMYLNSNHNERTKNSRYNIEVKYSNPSSNIQLGFMIVEGSEEIRVNGNTLTRGVDYQIDYFGGNVTMMNEAANDPNANLEILYEKHELVSFDKKTIIGTRAQMDFGENSFIGATALYYNQSVLNDKIEVGYEPTRNFIWDVNGRYRTELNGVTRFLDRLPIIETEKATSFSVEGEFAQVLPNPNSVNNEATGDRNGVAYIDDFEGAKRTTAPQVMRKFWRQSSAPLNPFTEQPLLQLWRTRLEWYNPYTPVPTRSIWPQASVSTRAQNETTNILRLKIKPEPHQEGLDTDSLWAGLISPFFSGDYDQTDSKFFEIWLCGTNGQLTVDLGRISEDWNGNGELDTEDQPEAGFTIGNGILEDSEDIGLDGCTDDYEDGWGGCLDPAEGTFQELYDDEEDSLINRLADLDDPNGDNWKEANPDRNDYSQINGTEGNRRQEGGMYPDSEDLDGSGFLDRQNDYFTKSFNLNPDSDDSVYVAGITRFDNGDPTNWRLYRIPLSHFARIRTEGSIGWEQIENMRLVISGADGESLLQIAKIELVGNEWKELGVADDTSAYVADDSVFAVAIINTDDNAGYDPPKGVRGEYDRINDIYSKEQSLVLKFDELPAGNRGAAEKTMLALSGDRAQSYLTYDRMKMYIYGNSSQTGLEQTAVEFFLQFGKGQNFYEITQPVYEGWDEDRGRNSVNLDLDWLTALKLADSSSVKKFNSTDIFTDSTATGVKFYQYTDENGHVTGKRVRIKGEPVLSRIQFMRAGVRNTSELPVSGEVWLDELRLSGVKKEKGTAMRVKTKLGLADLGSATISYSRKDADFHVLQQRLGSANTSENLNLNLRLSLDKFLPDKWGLSIPVNSTITQSVRRPKYYQGTDVLLTGEDIPDSLLTMNKSVNLSTSISKRSKSERKLISYTLDRININLSAKRAESSNNLVKRKFSESYNGKAAYNLGFGKDNYISPLKILAKIPVIGKPAEEFHLYYTPASVNANINVNESYSEEIRYVGDTKPNYKLGITRSYGINYKLTESLTTINYSRSINSNMDDRDDYPWISVWDLYPGIVTSENENLSLAYTPKLLEFLRPNFSYSAGYNWSKPRNSQLDGATIGTRLNFSGSFVLSPTKIIELFYKPKTTSGRPRRGTRPTPNQQQQPQQQEKERPILKSIHTHSKDITPLNLRYSSNVTRRGNGVMGETPTGYKFGWLPDHGLEYDPGVGTNTGDWQHDQDISLSSGLKLTKNINTTFSFTQRVSSSVRGSAVETRSMTRDALPTGEYLENSLPFSRWTVSWRGLQNWPILKNIARTITLDHSFSGSEARNWKFPEGINQKMPLLYLGSFIDDQEDKQQSLRLSASFSPLVGLSMQLKHGITLSSRMNYSRTLDETNGGQTYKESRAVTSSASYNHKGGINIPLPFMKDIDIQNNVNFALNFDLNEDKTFKRNDLDTPFGKKPEKLSNWKVGLRISYSFTTRVSGGIIYEYRESKHYLTGKKIDRDFGFDVNIAISG